MNYTYFPLKCSVQCLVHNRYSINCLPNKWRNINTKLLHFTQPNFYRRKSKAHVSPLVEELGSVPLQLLVPLVAHNGRPSPGKAFLGDIHMMPFHPLWPVATVAAVNKTSTFQEQRCSGYYRRFLSRVVKERVM